MMVARKRVYVLAGAALAASVVVGVLSGVREQPSGPPPQEPDLFSFVRQLPQSTVPGSRSDDSIPDPQWRMVFDHHLELYGVTQSAREAIGLAAGARRAEAQTLLDKYLRYRLQAQPLQAAIDAGRDMETSVAALQALRSAIFSFAEREALFPADQSYESFLLSRQTIIQDRTLGDDERHQRLHHLEASVPPEARRAEEMRSGVVRQVPSLQPESEDGVHRLAPAQ
jgi:hypothetical protein